MAITLTICALKGGVGKSTITINIAACLHRAGHRTLIVDSDPQGTCRIWGSKAAEESHDGPPVIGLNGTSLRRDLERVSAAFDAVVIDTPPRIAVETRAAMLAADMIVMPVTPGGADTWALHETLQVLEEASGFRPELKAAIVCNRADRTTLARISQQALGELEVPVLRSQLGNRVIFGEATLSGRSVIDAAAYSTAAKEVEALTREIFDTLKETKHAKRTTRSNKRQARQRKPAPQRVRAT